MPPTNVAVPRKSSWTSETLPRLPSVTKGKSLFEKEMELALDEKSTHPREWEQTHSNRQGFDGDQ